jgi:CIC family chloride channel protein
MKLSQVFQIKILRKLNRVNIDEEHLFFAITLLVGVGSGLIAVFMGKSIHWLTETFQTMQRPSIKSILAGSSFVFISGYITTRVVHWTSGSGIPQTKISLVVHHGIISFKQWFSKLITTILSLSSGLPLGIEGPTISITAGLGSNIGTFFGLSKIKIKSLLAVGAAGGIAAAFNTPIAAVTFVLEEVVGNFNTKALGPIIISSVAAAVTAQMFYGYEGTFEILKYKFEDPAELVFYFLVGISAAVLGPIWVKFILKLRDVHQVIFKGHRLSVMMTSFACVIGFAYLNPAVLGSGHHIINEVLLSKILDWRFIVSLMFVKFFFTSLCYSSGISGGLFMPTLFMGAMVGSLIGLGAQQIYPEASEVGAFAVVGMGAFFAAVLRAPFSSIMFIFEMTQDYRVILPLMIANVSAYMFSQKRSKGSIYEQMAEQDGVHLPKKDDYEILENLNVEQAMVEEVITLNANLSVKEALSAVSKSDITGYPILKHGLLYGVVSTTELGAAYAKFKGECFLSDICTRKLITIYPDQSLMFAFHLLNKYKISRLMVVSRINDKRLVGIITAENIVSRFGFHIQEENKKDVFDEFIKDSENEKKNNSDPASQE